MKKKIVFAGGGTAGHVMPNLAIISALGSGYDCVYLGGDGMEKELCGKRSIPFYRVDAVKLRRDAFFKNFSVPFKLNKCVREAKATLGELKPDLVFSKGGYAALPVVLAAKKLNIPVLAHESDMTPGIVTKLSKRRAEKILCAFEPCADRFKNGEYVGTPLDKKLYRGVSMPLDSCGKPVLLVMGGSSGAATLNAAVVEALPELLKTFFVVHLTGKNKDGAPPQVGYKSMSFCYDMPSLYASIDVAVSRGGANALSELIALKIPTVCVPLEKASRGDQIQNAEYYKEKGAIEVVREAELASLPAVVKKLYANRMRYKEAMSKIHADGTDKICKIIKEMLGAANG
ncbi:MAG: UDP-N-acetylglucosamine--N-acetylmuramyl-(pentapeptide) pyrophosphoryl-undecaprenol N-acetylglucosamine transferase [Clostridiales bacterium]|nr:UDP-N-acetylglucosamine--N-acetylmuramyl-(pentapeptide) pyrophosphoryl-undecaprenol N-acetylglucosamine transferase [Clostridiales bacterium]